jgi:hypothetical protein
MKQLLVASALAMLAFATVPAYAQHKDEPEEAERPRAERKASDRFCIQETGSHIIAARNARSRSDERECVNSGGRVYTRDDIDSTGSTDLRDALRRLDPAIR